MIKYKMQFTVSAETLFGLLAKVLPIEDLAVEEVMPKEARPDAAIRFDERFDLPKPAKKKQRKKRTSPGPNLDAGVNKVIMDMVTKGPQRTVELQRALEAAGYAANRHRLTARAPDPP